MNVGDAWLTVHMFEDDLNRGLAGLPDPAHVGGAAAGAVGVAGTAASLRGSASASRVRFVSADAAGGSGGVGVVDEAPIEGAGRGGRAKAAGSGMIHDYDLALLAGYRNDWVEATKRKAEAEADQARALAKIVALSQHVREELVPAASDTHDVVLRSFVAECATRVHVSDRALLGQCAAAWDLATRFPGALAALSAGRITTAHVRAITAAGGVLPGGAEGASARAGFEARALELAGELTPGRLRTKLRGIAEAMHPVALDRRHEESVACRRVWVRELEDGMAEVGAEVSAVLAYGIFDRLTQGARATKRAIGATGAADPDVDVRGVDQLRADIFADLLLTGVTGDPCAIEAERCAGLAAADGAAGAGAAGAAGAGFAGNERDGAAGRVWQAPTHRNGIHGVAPTITLLLPTGEGAEHATLTGYGPIDAVTARQLSAVAPGWNRVGLNEDGGVTSTDRYRLTEAMRRTLEARDQHCRFPGCRMPTHFCDVDHTVEWMNGGATTLGNASFLCKLCRRRHNLHYGDRRIMPTGCVLPR